MEKQESKNRFPTFPQPRRLRCTFSYGIRILRARPHRGTCWLLYAAPEPGKTCGISRGRNWHNAHLQHRPARDTGETTALPVPVLLQSPPRRCGLSRLASGFGETESKLPLHPHDDRNGQIAAAVGRGEGLHKSGHNCPASFFTARAYLLSRRTARNGRGDAPNPHCCRGRRGRYQDGRVLGILSPSDRTRQECGSQSGRTCANPGFSII